MTPASTDRTPSPTAGTAADTTSSPTPPPARPAGWVAKVTGFASRPGVPWAGALLIAVSAFLVRLVRIGEPNSFAFDETYYAKHALSLLQRGYVRDAEDTADAEILSGNTTDGIWTDLPEMVVHPEVGKWVIALGEWAFGMDPTGWRIASAVVGALMVLLMCRFATRVTGSVLLGWLAGFLLSIDGMHLVLSRLALLDIFLAFFLLGGVHCVVADRQWFRRRLDASPDPRDTGGAATWGPRLLARPWLLAAGVWFGLAIGTKWTALYPLALLGVWLWFANARARRRRGVSWPKAVGLSAVTDGFASFVQLIGVASVVYVLSWTGWLIHADEYEQHLSTTQYTTHEGGTQWPTALEEDAEGLGEVWQSLRSLASYHRDVYTFHTAFLNDATHPYASHPIGWPVMARPVGVDAQLDIQPGVDGCDAPEGSTCIRQVLLLGNPIIWWGGSIAMLACLMLWIGRRDWRFAVPVLGMAATWLPWFQYAERTIFAFYAITFLPFMVLALVMVLGAALGDDRAAAFRRSPYAPGSTLDGAPGGALAARSNPTVRRAFVAATAGVFVVVAIALFVYFWPIWTDELLTHSEWESRMWFKSWI